MGGYESYRSGLGFVESGIRYGYTDGSLWYLGECRLYKGPGDRNFIALNYDQLKSDVDSWINLNPAMRRTQPTSNEKKCLLRFEGELLGTRTDRVNYYRNYFIIGKPDPAPFTAKSDLLKLFTNPSLGIAGVGLGYADAYNDARTGFDDGIFWYGGESRIFSIAQLPSGISEISIPAGGPPVASGMKYYKGTDPNRIFITHPLAKSPFMMIDYALLVNLIENWRISQFPYQQTGAPDVLTAGFLWRGQDYWNALGAQVMPDELVYALRDSERNLHILIKYLPATMGGAYPSQYFATLPKQQGRTFGGLSLLDILASQYLTGASSKKRRKRKRGK